MNNQQRNFIRQECLEIAEQALYRLSKNSTEFKNNKSSGRVSVLNKKVILPTNPEGEARRLHIYNYGNSTKIFADTTDKEILKIYDDLRKISDAELKESVTKYKAALAEAKNMQIILDGYHALIKGLLFEKTDAALQTLADFKKVCEDLHNE